MKAFVLILIFLMLSCISVPKESITLSETLGKDLQSLKQSHVNTISIYYNTLESKIDKFIDEVYSPFIIQFVLESEFQSFENNEASIISSLEKAARVDATQEDTDQALQAMVDFQTYANRQIAQKRSELVKPIRNEKLSILKQINASYDQAIAANATLTGYLASVKDVKDAQTQSLAMIGVDRADIDESMLRASEILDQVIAQGQNLDTQAEEARILMNALIEKIKSITRN